jgi:alpha-acetolactate decarboxylase
VARVNPLRESIKGSLLRKGELENGMFDEVRTRTVQRQVRPFPPLTEAAKHQAEKVFNGVQGTLAGFRSPAYAQGIGVAGFHLHFLRQDKQAGGHALDYRLGAGKVRICTVHDLRVDTERKNQGGGGMIQWRSNERLKDVLQTSSRALEI